MRPLWSDCCAGCAPATRPPRGRASKAFFKRVLSAPDVASLLDEAQQARDSWRANRGADRTWRDRMQQMESLAFAREQAEEFVERGIVTGLA